VRVKNTAKILRETGLSFLPSQTAEREKKRSQWQYYLYVLWVSHIFCPSLVFFSDSDRLFKKGALLCLLCSSIQYRQRCTAMSYEVIICYLFIKIARGGFCGLTYWI
jgi:hypothetical protein